jgi:hypothetical protein
LIKVPLNVTNEPNPPRSGEIFTGTGQVQPFGVQE